MAPNIILMNVIDKLLQEFYLILKKEFAHVDFNVTLTKTHTQVHSKVYPFVGHFGTGVEIDTFYTATLDTCLCAPSLCTGLYAATLST